MAGKLWNLTYVVRAGKYFVWRLLRLAGLHDSPGSKNRNRIVELGRELHGDLLLWKWANDNELLLEGESLSAPCYMAIKRPAKRHYLFDASFDAMGGFCVERKVFWRYDLPHDCRMTNLRTRKKSRSWGDLHHHDQPVRVSGNDCDSVGHARISRRQAGRGRGPDTDERRYHGRGVVDLSMRWGEGQKGVLTHENARTPRTHRGVKPHGKTYSGRAKHPRGWYLALAPVGIGRQGQRANQLHRMVRTGHRVTGFGDFRHHASDYYL